MYEEINGIYKYLSASSTLSTAELEVGADIFNVFQVHHQVLYPLAGPATDGDRLRCLVVTLRRNQQPFVVVRDLGKTS